MMDLFISGVDLLKANLDNLINVINLWRNDSKWFCFVIQASFQAYHNEIESVENLKL